MNFLMLRVIGKLENEDYKVIVPMLELALKGV